MVAYKNGIAVVLPALGAGGAERVISLLTGQWAQQGHSVTLITFEKSDTEPYYDIDPRVNVVQLGIPPKSAGPFAALWQVYKRISALRRAVTEVKPLVVLSLLARANVITLLAVRNLSIPVIISERNNHLLQRHGLIWSLLRRATYPSAAAFVAITKGALDATPSALRPRAHVIPNPVLMPAAAPGGTREAEPQRTFRFAAVGRLVPQKGFDLLLHAFAAVAKDFPDWELVIWGAGPQRQNLEELRDALGLQHQVRFPGLSSRPGSWIAETDAFVLSSRFEGWGNALAEAMAAGLPVVSFNCDWGPSDLISDNENGFLVENGSVGGLSEKMAAIMADPQLRQRLGQAATGIMERYSLGAIIAQWDELIADVKNGRHGCSAAVRNTNSSGVTLG